MWRSKGVDLAAYNTNESADDLEDLRKALGASKISLWATSYGTHLALATLSVVIMVLMVIVFVGTFRRWAELLQVKTPIVDQFGEKVLVTVDNK